MRTFALAAVLVVDSGLLVAVIVWPWLIAAGVAAVMRLGLAGAVNGRDIDEVVDAAVRTGMPNLLGRWLRPTYGHRAGRGRRTEETHRR